MSICPSCNGVIGRDCFNPSECMEITQDMAERGQAADGEIYSLKQALDAQTSRSAALEDELRHVRKLAAYGLDNIAADPLQGYRHITEACDKALSGAAQ